jgi:hypothetical protein
LTDIISFVKEFELQVPKKQIFLALDVILKANPSRWWDPHKEGVEDWSYCRRLMPVIFGTELDNIAHKYTWICDPTDHIGQCRNIWGLIPKREWTHRFIHTLDTIPNN